MEMPYHFVAPNGIGKNKKVSLFFLKLRPILEVSFLELSYSWQLSQSVTLEDKMPFLWRLCGCVVSHLDAFPNQSHDQQERHVKAQHGHWQSASSRAWGKRPALLSQPKAVDMFLCSNIFTFVDVFINSPYPSTKWYSKSSTKWRCLTLAYDLVLI